MPCRSQYRTVRDVRLTAKARWPTVKNSVSTPWTLYDLGLASQVTSIGWGLGVARLTGSRLPGKSRTRSCCQNAPPKMV